MTDTVAGVFNTPLYLWQRELRERASLRVVVPAAVEPVTVDEAAEHLRIDAYGSPAEYPEASLLSAMIVAAREYIEHLTGLTLCPQTLELAGRSFSGLCRYEGDTGIALRTSPVRGLVSVTYVDSAGATQTIADGDMLLDDSDMLPTLYPAYGTTLWPAVRDQAGAVRIRFTAGYDAIGGSPSVAVLPYMLRAAVLLMVGHLYDNREETVRGEGGGTLPNVNPLGIAALVERYRLRSGFA